MPSPLFGSFAGYVSRGTVTSVSASIVVPRIIGGSPQGAAGTWIGSEGQASPGSTTAPFVQVGVNEVRLSVKNGQVQNGYFAFWSDVAVKFHPKPLFIVHPGDVLELAMTLSPDNWTLDAEDLNSGLTRSRVVGRDPRSRFNSAIWTQEDPASRATGSEIPYPDLSPARFTRLRVNGSSPASGDLLSQWLSTNTQAVFGPTAIRATGFAVVPLHPTRAALRYQQIAVQVDLATDVFVPALFGWTRSTSQHSIEQRAGSYAEALARNVAALESQTWPPAVASLVAHLVEATRNLRQQTVRLARVGARDLSHVRRYLEQRAVSSTSEQIRRRLGLPGVTGLSGSYVASNGGN